MNTHEDITNFQIPFNGPFPFSTNGVVIGLPSVSFAEEMQTKITFPGGSISVGTFHHENMHQWWGDNVSEDVVRAHLLQGGLRRPVRGLQHRAHGGQRRGRPGHAGG